MNLLVEGHPIIIKRNLNWTIKLKYKIQYKLIKERRYKRSRNRPNLEPNKQDKEKRYISKNYKKK